MRSRCAGKGFRHAWACAGVASGFNQVASSSGDRMTGIRLWMCATRRLASVVRWQSCSRDAAAHPAPYSRVPQSKRLACLQGDPIGHLALAGALPFVKAVRQDQQRFVRKACRK